MSHVSITQSDRYDVCYTDHEGVFEVFKRFDDQQEAEAYALDLARRLGCRLEGRAADLNETLRRGAERFLDAMAK